MSVLGQEPLTRRRYAAETRDANGYHQRGAATDTTFYGAAQPATERDLQVLPEGERTRTGIKVFSKTQLRTADRANALPADEVIVSSGQYAGTYKVMSTQGERAILPHYKAICLEVTEA